MADFRRPTNHHMGRRSSENDYSQPGMYHITLRVAEGMGAPLGVWSVMPASQTAARWLHVWS